MKTNVKFAKGLPAAPTSAVERQDRMRAYLIQTRPAFEKAVIKSRGLGKAANGVLAGPPVRT